MASLNTELLCRGAKHALNIDLTDTQIQLYEQFADMLVDWNANRLNLTRLVSPEDIAVKHILDSLQLIKAITIPQNARIIDIGTGAGIPGIPLKIMRPDLTITLLDSTAKKLRFCSEFISQAGLSNIDVIHGRAEEISRTPSYSKQYDMAVSRAVASLDKLLPWCHPFVIKGGTIIAMKGPLADEELEAARPISTQLKLEIKPILSYQLPEAEEPAVRNFVIGIVR